MDENSREGETSESAENSANSQRTKETEDRTPELENVGVKIKPVSVNQEIHVADGVGSSLDDTGTSSNARQPSLQQNDDKIMEAPNDDNDDDATQGPCPPPVNYMPRGAHQHRIRMAPTVEQTIPPGKPIIGPPPSYSFVMNQKAKLFKQRRSITPVNERVPPPTYSGMQRLYLTPNETQEDRFCGLQPLWRSHSQPALCPRCGIIILTTTHSHDSVATHVAALALCLFGCWPCCLLPYCMNACKNTYHHCPICQTFLGSYAPW